LPEGVKLKDRIESANIKYEKYSILEDIRLPGDMFELFGELLANNNFIKKMFRHIYTDAKREAAQQAIVDYLIGRSNKPGFNLNNISDKKDLLKQLLKRFLKTNDTQEKKDGFSKYIVSIFGTKDTRNRLANRVKSVVDSFDREEEIIRLWESALEFFAPKKQDGNNKIEVEEIVRRTVNENGNFIVLDISPRDGEVESENLQALFVKIIEERIVEAGAKLYGRGEKANCLIVMDEAHRFIAKGSSDERIRELTDEIVGSVRTTRKYGIGYMFITQTIESLDDEILRQMRIFSFGYGLTGGQELRKISDVVNNPSAIQLYKSFIDPSSNGRYPFMFFGPISPLSFTGSPLFIEVYTSANQFK
jgi:hypothetical protein